MWKRLRRRTFAPSRPALHADQIGLFLIVVVALGVGIFVALKAAA
jgi:hypothetical protein